MLTTFDWHMAGATPTPVGLGILTLWSGNLGSPSAMRQGLYLRQTLWLAFGILALLTAVLVNFRTLARFAYVVYGVLLALLIVVALVGEVAYGAQRGIRIAGWTLQPSEFMKLALILTLARYFEDPKERLGDLRLLVVPTFIPVAPVLVLLSLPA